MALTCDFRETVQARAKSDPAFRRALLQRGIACLLGGEVEAGMILLRQYVNASLAEERHPNPEAGGSTPAGSD